MRLPLRYAVPLLFHSPLAQRTANQIVSTSPIAFWRMDEGTGTALSDSSGNGYSATATATTWTPSASPFGTHAQSFDGSTSYVDIYSAGLASALDTPVKVLDEGCMLIWAKVSSASVWTDATARFLFSIFRDGNNRVFIQKTTTDNQITLRRNGSATADFVNVTVSDTDWFSLMVSWTQSGDELKAYKNGVQQGATQTGLLVAATSPAFPSTTQTIGAASTTPTNVWDGFLSYAVLWSKPADASMIALGTVGVG